MATIFPGTIVAYSGTEESLSKLDGWLLCDGTRCNSVDKNQNQNKNDLSALFSAIGFSWGGDGGDWFHLPDLRGQFLRGVSGSSNIDPDANTRDFSHPGLPVPGNSGNKVGSSQKDAFEDHQHTTGAGNNPPDASGNNYLPVMGSFIKNIMTGSASKGSGSETRPINKAVYYLIKF